MRSQLMACSVLLSTTILCLIAGCDKTQDDWNTAIQQHTIDGYSRFVEKYPQSDLADSAEVRIQVLHFEESVQQGNEESFRRFLELYPEGMHTDSMRRV